MLVGYRSGHYDSAGRDEPTQKLTRNRGVPTSGKSGLEFYVLVAIGITKRNRATLECYSLPFCDRYVEHGC